MKMSRPWHLLLLLFSPILLHGALAQSAPLPHPEIAMRLSYLVVPDSLTTDRALALDPGQINPHRSRWVLRRELKMDGLGTIEQPGGRYGVRVGALVGVTQSHLRPSGPWYQEIGEFPCTAQPVSWFATQEGSRKAADSAARLWETELSEAKLKLEWLLGKIAEPTPQLAQIVAVTAFQAWLAQVTDRWRERVATCGRAIEWEEYRKDARAVCAAKKQPGIPRRDWTEMMEPVPTTGEPKVLARAPARRWGKDGPFSVRLVLQLGEKTLDGQFLIDSAARTSLVSPTWLRLQGGLPVQFESTQAPIEKIRWGSARRRPGDGSLARLARFNSVELSGYGLALKEFLLWDTLEMLKHEGSGATCCAGVLGTDFLRQVVTEFKPASGAELNEVVFYAPEGFRPVQQKREQQLMDWIEAALTQFGEAASACAVKGPSSDLFGIIWNTAEEFPLTLTRATSVPKQGLSGGWSVRCGTRVVASDLKPATSVYSPDRRPGIAADIGISLLARDRFILDLPHGRIWLPSKRLK